MVKQSEITKNGYISIAVITINPPHTLEAFLVGQGWTIGMENVSDRNKFPANNDATINQLGSNQFENWEKMSVELGKKGLKQETPTPAQNNAKPALALVGNHQVILIRVKNEKGPAQFFIFYPSYGIESKKVNQEGALIGNMLYEIKHCTDEGRRGVKEALQDYQQKAFGGLVGLFKDLNTGTYGIKVMAFPYKTIIINEPSTKTILETMPKK